jgi:hypothetical protein
LRKEGRKKTKQKVIHEGRKSRRKEGSKEDGREGGNGCKE